MKKEFVKTVPEELGGGEVQSGRRDGDSKGTATGRESFGWHKDTPEKPSGRLHSNSFLALVGKWKEPPRDLCRETTTECGAE